MFEGRSNRRSSGSPAARASLGLVRDLPRALAVGIERQGRARPLERVGSLSPSTGGRPPGGRSTRRGPWGEFLRAALVEIRGDERADRELAQRVLVLAGGAQRFPEGAVELAPERIDLVSLRRSGARWLRSGRSRSATRRRSCARRNCPRPSRAGVRGRAWNRPCDPSSRTASPAGARRRARPRRSRGSPSRPRGGAFSASAFLPRVLREGRPAPPARGSPRRSRAPRSRSRALSRDRRPSARSRRAGTARGRAAGARDWIVRSASCASTFRPCCQACQATVPSRPPHAASCAGPPSPLRTLARQARAQTLGRRARPARLHRQAGRPLAYERVEIAFEVPRASSGRPRRTPGRDRARGRRPRGCARSAGSRAARSASARAGRPGSSRTGSATSGRRGSGRARGSRRRFAMQSTSSRRMFRLQVGLRFSSSQVAMPSVIQRGQRLCEMGRGGSRA